MPSPPPAAPDSSTPVTFFSGASNVSIQGGIFTADNRGAAAQDNLKVLYDKVAMNAILNAGGRESSLVVYPGTRVRVLEEAERWIDGQGGRMLWLRGAEGVGKSAIMQTLTERCQERDINAASFFFLREDPTRNMERPLVATLLYQILELNPATRACIAEVVASKPLIFDGTLKAQFAHLISAPLRMAFTDPNRPVVLLIDGIDECGNSMSRIQQEVIHILHSLVAAENSPFVVIVASQAKNHFIAAFSELSPAVAQIDLNQDHDPAEDIRYFVRKELGSLKQIHHVTEDWPSEFDVETFVRRSKGGFAHVDACMRYMWTVEISPAFDLKQMLRVVLYHNEEGEEAEHRHSSDSVISSSSIVDWLQTKSLVETEKAKKKQGENQSDG